MLLASNISGKATALIEMAVCKIEKETDRGNGPVSIKYHIFGSFKEGMILLYQSILGTKRMSN